MGLRLVGFLGVGAMVAHAWLSVWGIYINPRLSVKDEFLRNLYQVFALISKSVLLAD